MFQSFEVTARPEQGPPRLAALRVQMDAMKLDGFLIPRADVHQGEYVAKRDERLAWLTGFTGSAGFCAALRSTAGVFIDGRYRTQVKSQVAEEFTPVPWPEVTLAGWLKEQLETGTIGFDPWLHTVADIEKTTAALAGTSIALSPCDNLVDQIWEDQPEPPLHLVRAHPIEFAGETAKSKIDRLSATLRNANQAAAIITLPDSIMWLLNLRGADVAHNPVAHGFAILHASGKVDLFMDARKLTDLGDHLGPEVTQFAPSDFAQQLRELDGSIRIDPSTVPYQVAQILGDKAARGDEICALPKARKNPAEIEGAAQAHLRDAAAMVELLSWLDAQPAGSLDRD